MELEPLPGTHTKTREALQRVATHVLARRRAALCGKFGLRATPGGIGTPACGPDHEVVRVAGTRLIREISGPVARSTSMDLTSSTLVDAAALVGVDLSEQFEVGHDTPPLGDPTAKIALDADAAQLVHRWFEFGWTVLDSAIGALGAEAQPSVVQLWPEHFDAGCDVAAGPKRRVNLGASPGDSFSVAPYLYVGPWDDARPGDSEYWNAPFGAVLRYETLRGAPDPVEAGYDFLLRGVERLAS